MELNISRDALMKPLSQVAGVVERRQTLPILAYALVRFADGRLSMTGTDLEVEVQATVEAKGSDGEMTVPARKLLDICRGLPAETNVKIALKGDKAVISSGRSRFTLVTMNPADFPTIEASEWVEHFELPQKVLKGMLEATQFCMAHQDVRYYLNGMMLELDGKTIRTVATDGHRMALREIENTDGASGARQVIIPRKGVLELARFLDESDSPATVHVGANHVRVELPNLTFTSKLIDGRFPDYTKVVPRSQNKELVAERQDLRDAFSRAAILSNEKYRGVRLNTDDGVLKITAHNPEQEEAEEELAVEYKGEPLEIGFNVNYLIEAVTNIGGDKVQIGLNDPNSSCTVVAPGDSSTLYVIMPMRL
jgi:DNA polymerase-3 subunit beta